MTHDPHPIVSGELSVTLDRVGAWTVLTCEGDLDVTTSSKLRTSIREASLDAGVIIDINQVGFIDSTALGVLIGGQKRVHREGRVFRLVVTSPTILRILTITGLDEMITLCATVQDATGQAARDEQDDDALA